MPTGFGLGLFTALWLFASAGGESHQQGVNLYKAHKYAEAIASLEKSVRTEAPDSAEYKESVLMIGQSYFMLSQAPRAIPWLEKAPALNEANYMLGYAYLQAGDAAKSEAAFARLFGVPAGSARGHLIAGQMLLKKEYRDEATAEVNKALALDPALPLAHFLLGEMAIGRGEIDLAVTEFRREIEKNPGDSMAWYRLGDAYARKNNYDDAVPSLQRAIWLNTNFSGPFILLGKCYLKLNNFTNAEGILRSALSLDPRNREAQYLLGRTLLAEGRKDEANAILDKLK
ncbi:MAG TPA: tetratricopeptide repeat protein [Bryobacteraceae bacterium]|jgi:tetratricopeptide (TPR) repeat protein|nr:tetratricopeptide repeat protein [Bryobacteraceae bacterium]